LAKERKKMLVLICNFFSREKREQHTSNSNMKLYEKKLQKQIGDLNSSWKNTQFLKKQIIQNGIWQLNLSTF
jgi:hypothetical protein